MSPSPKYDIPWELITDSFTGSLSDEDEQKFHQWLSSDPDNRERYFKLQELWKNGLDDYRFYLVADEFEAWNDLNAKLKKEEKEKEETWVINSLFKRRKHLIMNLTAIAATFLILVMTGYWLIIFRNNPVVYKTASDEQKEIMLLDGSEVILKPQTRIEVPKDYNKANRIVVMESGEASFDVSHQDKLPFIVSLGTTRVEDIGTSFTIQKEEEQIKVSVRSGKVAFVRIATNETKELTAGTSITFNNKNESFGDINYNNSKKITNESLLNFDNTPLSEVIVSIQKVYGNKIQIADSSIAQKRLTAHFDGVPYENLITIICKSLNLEYSVIDSIYLLNEKREE
jgi:transmembrane sensor